MTTLRYDGLQKAILGITTPEEVINVTWKDEIFDEDSPKGSDETGILYKNQMPVIQAEELEGENDYDSRIYSRLKQRVAIRYSIVKQDEEDSTQLITEDVEHSSVTKDISAGGLRFVSGYTLPAGTILSLKIQLGKEQRSIDCMAKICRVEDDNLSSMFNLVVYYLDISSADRVKIKNFITVKMNEADEKLKQVK